MTKRNGYGEWKEGVQVVSRIDRPKKDRSGRMRNVRYRQRKLYREEMAALEAKQEEKNNE